MMRKLPLLSKQCTVLTYHGIPCECLELYRVLQQAWKLPYKCWCWQVEVVPDHASSFLSPCFFVIVIYIPP